jgi:hypothetical protein
MPAEAAIQTLLTQNPFLFGEQDLDAIAQQAASAFWESLRRLRNEGLRSVTRAQLRDFLKVNLSDIIWVNELFIQCQEELRDCEMELH